MANNKQRYINTRFWNDTYVSELDPVEKLLFIYFLTNEHTNISGIYELPIKIIGIETGIDSSMINKILPRLEAKIRYVKGFVVIKNFLKHQETKSNLTILGIKNCLKDLNTDFLKELISKGFYEASDEILEGVCKGYARVSNYSNLDSNLDSNSITSKNDVVVEDKKKGEEEKYNFQAYLEEMEKSKRRDVQVIAFYFKKKNLKFDSLQEVQSAIKRHLRPAKEVANFPDEKIVGAYKVADVEYKDKYTVETLLKILTR